MYNYGNYGTTSTQGLDSLLGSSTKASGLASAGVWTLVSLILAIVGAIVIYFLFVQPEKKYDNKFVTWLREFLNFQAMLIEPIMKIAYTFIALFITLSSFSLISTSFVAFLLMLIVGNLVTRVLYEFTMILISIWKNTKEINKKMK